MPLRLLEVVVPKHRIKTVTQATLSDLCRQRKAAKDFLPPWIFINLFFQTSKIDQGFPES
jgi:hypothetical protein